MKKIINIIPITVLFISSYFLFVSILQDDDIEEVKDNTPIKNVVIENELEEQKLDEQIQKEQAVQDAIKFREDFINKDTLNLENYDTVYSITNQISSSIKSLLQEKEISYLSSDNNSLVFSKTNSYEKFNNEYFEFFIFNVDVNYKGGKGNLDLIINKEFHRDSTINLSDKYISLMYEIYKEFNTSSTEEKFESELQTAIDQCLNGAYGAYINGKGINIKVSLSGATLAIDFSMNKGIDVEQLGMTVKNYNTLNEFENMGVNLFENNNNQNKTLNNNENYRYTYMYQNNLSGKFTEQIGFKFRSVDRFTDYGNKQFESLNGKVLKIDNDTYPYIEELIERFNIDLGFYINIYLDKKQFADEIQKFAMKERLFNNNDINKKIKLNGESSMPIPGVYDLSISNDIVTFILERDVTAEGITMK